MSMKINDNKPVPTQTPRVASSGIPKLAGLTGAQASANLEGMLAGVVSAQPGGLKGTQSSLLGPMVGESSGAATFAGNQSFSMASLGVGLGQQVSLADTSMAASAFAAPGSPQWHTETGQALGRAVARFEEQQFGRQAQIVNTAIFVAQNKPQVMELAARAMRQSTPGMGRSVSNLDAAEGGAAAHNVDDGTTGDFVRLASGAAKDAGMDITKMPIEEAISYMMTLCIKGSTEELQDQLKDMDKIRKKKSALREAETLLKKQQADAQTALRAEYQALSPEQKAAKSQEDYCKDRMVNLPAIVMNFTTGKASVATGGEVHANATDDIATLGGSPIAFGDIAGTLGKIGDQKDSMSELAEESSQKFQIISTRYTQITSMQSNIAKKFADTLSGIIGNMK